MPVGWMQRSIMAVADGSPKHGATVATRSRADALATHSVVVWSPAPITIAISF
jgi:hypothetical protein